MDKELIEKMTDEEWVLEHVMGRAKRIRDIKKCSFYLWFKELEKDKNAVKRINKKKI